MNLKSINYGVNIIYKSNNINLEKEFSGGVYITE